MLKISWGNFTTLPKAFIIFFFYLFFFSGLVLNSLHDVCSIIPYMTPTLSLPSSLSKVQVNLSALSTKPVHPAACLLLTAEAISHLLLMPYFNSALLQLSLGLVFFLSLLSNPDSPG